MVYINCPICGHRIIKGEKVSIAIIKCNKCNGIVSTSIKRNNIHIQIKKYPRDTVHQTSSKK